MRQEDLFHQNADPAVAAKLAAREDARLQLEQETRAALIEKVLHLLERKNALKAEIERLKTALDNERTWNRISLSFLLSGVLFGVVLSPGFSQIWIIPLALVGSLISGFLAGFLLNKAQYLIRTHIYERFRHTKAAQAAAYIMLFVMSAAAILIVWCVRSMWF
ncbi:MAG: hypothetical protein ABFD03_03550 [Clostridiaceae bacterium]|nr:hypothetical protein [Feifaniaceae bacterium]